MEPSQYCRRKNNVREGRIFTISMIVIMLETERGLHHIKEKKEREHALLWCNISISRPVYHKEDPLPGTTLGITSTFCTSQLVRGQEENRCTLQSMGVDICKSFNKVIADLWYYTLNQKRVPANNWCHTQSRS